MVSLLIHALFFAFSGRTFIHHVEFSVQPSSQMVEVSIERIEEMKYSEAGDKRIKVPAKIANNKGPSHSISGVKVKANPDYFQNPPPEYPELAKQMRQEGIVMLSVDVDRSGDPVKVEILQSSGHRLLDQAAWGAVTHWKFKPGSIAGVPVDSTVTVPIRFRLEKS